jgi:Zn-dependent M28 family amino/carboxypeptidase
VVISAHLDHVGVGQPINGDRIYNGAMDNAAGTASLIELAKMAASGPPLKRSILFVAVTGEEKGLLGSKYFAAHPTVKPEQIIANVNVDMFLPLFPLKSLTVYGLDESTLGDLCQAVGKEMGIRTVADREPERNIFIRSDQYNFIRQGVPAVFFKFDADPGTPEDQALKTWLKERYHGPADDTAQPVDKAAAARFDQYVLTVADRIADAAARPRWKDSSFFRRFAKGS